MIKFALLSFLVAIKAQSVFPKTVEINNEYFQSKNFPTEKIEAAKTSEEHFFTKPFKSDYLADKHEETHVPSIEAFKKKYNLPEEHSLDKYLFDLTNKEKISNMDGNIYDNDPHSGKDFWFSIGEKDADKNSVIIKNNPSEFYPLPLDNEYHGNNMKQVLNFNNHQLFGSKTHSNTKILKTNKNILSSFQTLHQKFTKEPQMKHLETLNRGNFQSDDFNNKADSTYGKEQNEYLPHLKDESNTRYENEDNSFENQIFEPKEKERKNQKYFEESFSNKDNHDNIYLSFVPQPETFNETYKIYNKEECSKIADQMATFLSKIMENKENIISTDIDNRNFILDKVETFVKGLFQSDKNHPSMKKENNSPVNRNFNDDNFNDDSFTDLVNELRKLIQELDIFLSKNSKSDDSSFASENRKFGQNGELYTVNVEVIKNNPSPSKCSC